MRTPVLLFAMIATGCYLSHERSSAPGPVRDGGRNVDAAEPTVPTVDAGCTDGWQVEVIAEYGASPSGARSAADPRVLVLPSTEEVHVLYVEYAEQPCTGTTCPMRTQMLIDRWRSASGAAWSVQRVDEGPFLQLPSIAMDAGGGLHALYVRRLASGALELAHARRAPRETGWAIERAPWNDTITAPFGLAVEIPGNIVHASYVVEEREPSIRPTLRYLRREAGVASIEDVVDGTIEWPGFVTDLALEGGQPHVVYCGSRGDGGARVAAPDAAGWSVVRIDTFATYSRIGVDAAGRTLALYQGDTLRLRLAILAGADLAEPIASLDELGVGTSAGPAFALAISGAGAPQAVLADQSTGSLNYAWLDAGGSWSFSTIEAGVRARAPSIAAGVEGGAHVAYLAGDDVRYAHLCD